MVLFHVVCFEAGLSSQDSLGWGPVKVIFLYLIEPHHCSCRLVSQGEHNCAVSAPSTAAESVWGWMSVMKNQFSQFTGNGCFLLIHIQF